MIKALFLTLIMLASSNVSALIVVGDPINNTEGLGGFEADFVWNGHSLDLVITNTSDDANGGYITGFLLNTPGLSGFNTVTWDNNLDALMPVEDAYSGVPMGYFDYGMALGGNFLGGGSPTAGIGIGETGTFRFSDWYGLDGTEDVLDFVANQGTPDASDTHLLVRFKGFEDGGSDKVSGMLTPQLPPVLPPPPPPNIQVTEPTVLLLLLIASLMWFTTQACNGNLRRRLYATTKTL